MNTKTMIPIFLVLIILIGVISYSSQSLILKVNVDGKLSELKIDDYVDTSDVYKKGQKYKVTYHFILGEMFKRNIELVN